MGKDLYPRFKCPMCGWLAHYSMLEKAPHNLKVVGMKVDGFQGISYHKIWGIKREYKEFLRLKIREVAKELGLKLADEEEEITDEYEDDEKEIAVEHEYEHKGKAEAEPITKPLKVKSSRQVVEIPTERIESIPVEHLETLQHKRWKAQKPKAFLRHPVTTRATTQVQERDYVASVEDGYVTSIEDGYVITMEPEFVKEREG